jgi:hypothetical protein
VLIRGDDVAYAGGGAPQLAAATPVSATPVAPLTGAELAPVVAAAINRWSVLPGMAADDAVLRGVPFAIADLPGSMLGQTIGNTIVIDPTAAGYGWFVDLTPLDNAEFRSQGGQLVASASSPASGRMDLLTVVLHELGHILGLEDLSAPDQAGDLMGTWLAPGARRLPAAQTPAPASVGPVAAAAGVPTNTGRPGVADPVAAVQAPVATTPANVQAPQLAGTPDMAVLPPLSYFVTVVAPPAVQPASAPAAGPQTAGTTGGSPVVVRQQAVDALFATSAGHGWAAHETTGWVDELGDLVASFVLRPEVGSLDELMPARGARR